MVVLLLLVTYNKDIIGIALDLDNGAVYFAKNGTYGLIQEFQPLVLVELAL
jgi:hypothetical protein